MLAITDDAAVAIDEVLTQREMPSEAGVRLTTETSRTEDGADSLSLRMELAPKPESGDEVLENAPVFIEPETAPLLEEKLLDADRSGDGVRFTLLDQTP
ncbi:MAG: Fe-S cluster assembly protein HesB [Actinobacteria bacterium]|nr:Fe-S cluster assembly protein HesB [Actinomycetota bacterium]